MPAPYYEKMVVPDIAALKELTTLSTPAIADGIFMAVADRGDGSPDWYYYKETSTDVEALPQIVEPTTSPGRWFQFAFAAVGPTQIRAGTTYPTAFPPTVDPQTDGKTDIYFYLTVDVQYGTVGSALLFVGVDKTGQIGANGWIAFYQWTT
jgi:hypothetical protein